MMQIMPAGYEWIFIIVIAVILIFGVKKIPQLARGFGRASVEYQKAKIEAKREIQQIRNGGTINADREKLEAIADALGIDHTNKNDDELRNAIQIEINKSKNKI